MPKDKIDRMFAALANPVRLRMMHLLQAGERSAEEVVSALSLRRSSAARHLQVLCAAGLVSRRGRGERCRYSLASVRGPLHSALLACVASCFEWKAAGRKSQ
jgi:DNA-binding transcriptional ArsR family regulator